MAGCETQIFSGITQAHFACLLQTAQSRGINISGNNGTATGSGITITWTYDPAAQKLTIQCTDKPMFLGCGVISSQIRDLVNNCTSV
ncbi:MAG: hypothetical protein JOZ33_06385 [Acidobacteriaceae bacterium]|nr:hypothetical protein [Acidobacteriaceae bacterium]